MAAGQRKVKIVSIEIARANPVTFEARWRYVVENVVGADEEIRGGTHLGTFGTAAVWRAMTGAQMEAYVTAEVTASVNTPARESVT